MTDRRNNLALPARGFTLTEVLIAMALVAVLLVGIGRIFQITSDTIKTGQAFQLAMRSQKAIYTSLSRDVLGYASNGNIGESDNNSGMMPSADQPFLIITNYRVPTFANQREMANSGTGFSMPAGTPSASGQEIFAADSATIRGGASIYTLGSRNWRTDTLSFCARGEFVSQTSGVGANYVSPTVSQEAWIWYGHLRTFVSSNPGAAQENLNYTNYFGNPGVPYTKPTGSTATSNPGSQPNRNNFFAGDFRLGRMSILLRPSAIAADGRRYVRDDAGAMRPFLFRPWVEPTSTSTPTIWPLTPLSDVRQANATATAVTQVTVPGNPANAYKVEQSLVDVAAATAKEIQERLEFRSAQDPNWWTELFVDYSDRFYVNPYPQRPLDAARSAQRSNLLADGCSQFIVEYAGDYLTQVGTTTTPGPDGVIDYVDTVNGRMTRWYGLPRNVILTSQNPNNPADPAVIENNQLPGGGNGARLTSPDVIPLRDLIGQQSFERKVPAGVSNYFSVVTESGDLDDTGYVCVWSSSDLQAGRGPKLIRVIVDTRDPSGALGSGVTQEYVFPVPQD
jgi:prepilin-type N-terminal cleavage/methylation domain-containing protein